jgi:hypothetical protein
MLSLLTLLVVYLGAASVTGDGSVMSLKLDRAGLLVIIALPMSASTDRSV